GPGGSRRGEHRVALEQRTERRGPREPVACRYRAGALVVRLGEQTVPRLDLRQTRARPRFAIRIVGHARDDDLLEVAERPGPRRVQRPEPAERTREIAFVRRAPGE